MVRQALTIVGYMVASFSVQALSHFVINRAHYAEVTHLRVDVIFPLGIGTMVVQGLCLTVLYAHGLDSAKRSIRTALAFAWLCGAFLVSYIALGEAAKYRVPSVGSWIVVEIGAGFAQFTLFGIVLGALYRPPSTEKA